MGEPGGDVDPALAHREAAPERSLFAGLVPELPIPQERSVVEIEGPELGVDVERVDPAPGDDGLREKLSVAVGTAPYVDAPAEVERAGRGQVMHRVVREPSRLRPVRVDRRRRQLHAQTGDPGIGGEGLLKADDRKPFAGKRGIFRFAEETASAAGGQQQRADRRETPDHTHARPARRPHAPVTSFSRWEARRRTFGGAPGSSTICWK